jgi:broad specificity phosphatase PhoE
MNTKFYIFRHGETFATKAGTGYGMHIFTASILPEARPAVERLAKYLKEIKTDFHVSSEFRRCKQTAQIISEVTSKEFVYDKRVNEYFLEPYWFLKRRIQSLLKEIELKKYKSVCVCTHGAVISAFLHILTPEKSRLPFNIFNFPPPGVLTIIESNKAKQINFNNEV